MDRAPHYLRVVQALALVSGFGSVAIVVGGFLLDSCYSEMTGPVQCPESDPGCNGGEPFDGQAAGSMDAGVPVVDEDAASSDAGETGTDAAPEDASTDALAGGGPLLPPELPAWAHHSVPPLRAAVSSANAL